MSDDPVEEARDRLADALEEFLETPEPDVDGPIEEWDEEAVREYVTKAVRDFYVDVEEVRAWLDDKMEEDYP